MATQYFRITAYYPAEDLSVIMDANGMYEKLWQFSSEIIQNGLKVLEVSGDEKFLDGNIQKTAPDPDRFILRAYAKGMPGKVYFDHNGITYHAVKVGEKIYIPDRGRIYEEDAV